MDRIAKDQLTELLAPHPEPCVSIFMPTVRAGAETLQNPIRFKNLVRAAEAKLAERGLGSGEVAELMAPATRLIGDHDFWQHQADGLAYYLAPGFERRLRLPLAFDELAVVEGRFHLKSLFPLLDGDGAFHILALSKGRVRLFEASRFAVEEVELDGVPTSLTEALGEEVTEPQIQFHNVGATPGGGRGDRSPIFHGHGAGEDDAKDELRRFFLRVDQGLRETLDGEAGPLVLAGVDYLLPIFRDASRHPDLVAGGITGNPEELGPDELRRRAWELVEPRFRAAREQAAAKFRELAGTGRASGQLDEVVPAAVDGRVGSLFVARGVRRWGSFDPAERAIRLHDQPGPGSEDLLDLAAVQSYLHGGAVHVVAPAEVPGGEPLAAVFRY